MTRRNPTDFDEADAAQFICRPLSITTTQLPKASYRGADGQSFWKASDLQVWLGSHLPTLPLAQLLARFSGMARFESQLYPGDGAEQHTERAMQRWAAVAAARIAMRREP
jgi:hypothetical protein